MKALQTVITRTVLADMVLSLACVQAAAVVLRVPTQFPTIQPAVQSC